MENPNPIITPEVPIPAQPVIEAPAPPSPTPEISEKKTLLSGEKLEIAQLFVLGLIAAAFATQIYYFRKKAMEESDYMKLENRVSNLENKVLEV
jgi:hypothetical protein